MEHFFKKVLKIVPIGANIQINNRSERNGRKEIR